MTNSTQRIAHAEACCYLKAGVEFNNRVIAATKRRNLSHPDLLLMYPAALNLALALEVFLKGTIIETNAPGGFYGHDVKGLWDRLDVQIRSDLESVASRQGLNKTVAETLTDLDSPFLDWRYAFEGNSFEVPLTELIRLCNVFDLFLRPLVIR